MEYAKPPLSIEEQIRKLKERGLVIDNEPKAFDILSKISYYRLRAYTYPFQDNSNPNHPFPNPISLDEVITYYTFDSKLRVLIFEILEKIEIAFRTQVITHFALTYGSHWYTKNELFQDQDEFIRIRKDLNKEINRSDETFIKHYKEKYTKPINPPSWMSLEVCSFGVLSRLFENLLDSPEKRAVVKYFGLTRIEHMENWAQCLSLLRNVCAHHGRLWNRRFATHIKLPLHPIYPFLDRRANLYTYKMYSYLCCLEYITRIIEPEFHFKKRLLDLLQSLPQENLRYMGFPSYWHEESFWK